MIVYIIEVVSIKDGFKSVSQEGYSTYEKAVEFINSRAGNIIDCGNGNYRNEEYSTGYTIRDVRIL